MSVRPWYKWYPQDWRGEPRLRLCSLAARGLWRELLDAMHEAVPRGHLIVEGRAPSDVELVRLVGASSTSEVRRLLAELEAHQVFSRTRAGVIVSRRMVRDSEKEADDRRNGRKGGNPKLWDKGGVNPPLNPQPNPPVKPGDKAQIPEARDQKDRTPSQQRDNQSARAGGEAGHQEHAFCGTRFCVPRFLLDDHRRQLGSLATSTDLHTCYATWDREIGDTPLRSPKAWLTSKVAGLMRRIGPSSAPSDPDSAPDIWSRILERVETQVNQHTFATWFRPTRLLSDDGDRLRVVVPNEACIQWIERHHAGHLAAALRDVGRPDVTLEFVPKSRMAKASLQEVRSA